MKADTTITRESARTSGLDPAIAGKIARLRDENERVRAMTDWLRTRHDEARQDAHRAEQHRIRYATEGGRRLKPDQQFVVPAAMVEAVTTAVASRDRLAKEIEDLRAQVEPMGRVLPAIEQAVTRGTLTGRAATVVAVAGDPGDWLEEIEQIRTTLAPMREEMKTTARAPVALAEALTRLEQYLDEHAAHIDVQGFLGHFLDPDPDATERPWLPPDASRLLYGKDGRVTPYAVLCLLLQATPLRKQLVAALPAILEARGGPGLASADRVARRTALREQLFSAEVREEALILALERERIPCPRRPDADSIAVATTVLAEGESKQRRKSA